MLTEIGTFVRRMRELGLSFRVAAGLLLLNGAAILLEGFGVAMFLPILQFIEAGGDTARLAGRHWQAINDALRALGLPLDLGILLLVSFLAFLGRQVFTYISHCYKARVRQETAHALRTRIFRGYTRANAAHHDQSLLGELINEVNVELPRGVNALYGTVHLASIAMLIVFYLTGLLLLSPWMTLISVAILFLTAFVLRGLIESSRQTSGAITQANQRLSAFMIDRLRSIRLIRLSRTEAAELEHLSLLSARQRDNEIRLRKLAARIEASTEPVALFAGLMMLYVGYTHLDLQIGVLGLFLLVLLRLLPVTKEALKTYQSIVGQWASLRVIEARLNDMRAAREPRGGKRTFAALRSAIRFDNVAFSYVEGASALASVDFEIPAARMTAIVGPSGSGKSTLIDLLPRLRDPERGLIAFDGVPIAEFSIESLRAGIAFVPQKPHIFNVTIAEHIRYGRADARDEEVREAARLAGAAEFVERLPAGYNSQVGEEGASLSGGERQRLDLARAIVQRAPILVLDEPTSALDAHNEVRFRDALRRIRAETDTTVIIVGHRLSTVADADRIVVLVRGRVAEIGTHAELMRAGGWYANALLKQQGAGDLADSEVA